MLSISKLSFLARFLASIVLFCNFIHVLGGSKKDDAGDDDDLYSFDDYTKNKEYEYWGAYLGLFGGIYILMACISKSGFFDKFVKDCTIAAYECVENELKLDSKTKVELEICAKNEANYLKEKSQNTDKPQSRGCLATVIGSCTGLHEEFPYDRCFHTSFLRAFLDKRAYYGIQLAEDDSNVLMKCLKKILCKCFDERAFDCLFYVSNNSPLISMAMCSRAHPLSRAEKRNSFFIINAISLLFAILFMVLNKGTGDLSNNDVVVINIFVVTPLMMMVDKIMYYIQACPCLLFQSKYKCIQAIQSFFQAISQIFSVVIALGCIGVYFVDGWIAKVGKWFDVSGFDILGTYMYQIFVVSQGISLIQTISHFTPFYCGIKLCCVQVWVIGSWEAQKKIHQYKIDVANNNQKKFESEEEYLKECVFREQTIIPLLLNLVLFKEEEAPRKGQFKEVEATEIKNSA